MNTFTEVHGVFLHANTVVTTKGETHEQILAS
jgi:hypothetical protein